MTEEEIRKAELELKRHKINAKKTYKDAVKFHNKMVSGNFYSDKLIIKWDIAILIIRNYRRKHYLEWLKQ